MTLSALVRARYMSLAWLTKPSSYVQVWWRSKPDVDVYCLQPSLRISAVTVDVPECPAPRTTTVRGRPLAFAPAACSTPATLSTVSPEP